MSEIVEEKQFQLDWLKWLVVGALVAGAIYGNWYYSAESVATKASTTPLSGNAAEKSWMIRNTRCASLLRWKKAGTSTHKHSPVMTEP